MSNVRYPVKAEQLVPATYAAFAQFDRPETCIDPELYEPERDEYEQMLQGRSRTDLAASDLGQRSWSAEPYLTPSAMAHFMPRLVDLAVNKARDAEGDFYMMWFINSMSGRPAGKRFSLFDATHVAAVHRALNHLMANNRSLIEEECWLETLEEALTNWSPNLLLQRTASPPA